MLELTPIYMWKIKRRKQEKSFAINCNCHSKILSIKIMWDKTIPGFPRGADLHFFIGTNNIPEALLKFQNNVSTVPKPLR